MKTIPPEPFIYFIKMGDFVKIGYSRNVERRLKELDCLCPIKPTLVSKIPGSKATESKLQRHLSKFHSNAEWFKWNTEIEHIAMFGLPDLSHIGPNPSSYSRRTSIKASHLGNWANPAYRKRQMKAIEARKMARRNGLVNEG